MTQHLTIEQSVFSVPTGMNFNAYLSKEMLLQLMDNTDGGIRIYFGEHDGQRTIVTVSASSPDPGNVELSTRIKSDPTDFPTNTPGSLEASTRMASIQNPEGNFPPGFEITEPSAYYPKNDLMDLLDVNVCTGLRIFTGSVGIHENDPEQRLSIIMNINDPADSDVHTLFPTLIAAGVNQEGMDTGINNTEFIIKPYIMSLMPCPPKCGQ